MKNTRLRILLPLGLSLAALAAPVSLSYGQVSNLDQTTLIEGLRKEGMGELLKHLVKKLNADPKVDPTVLKQVLINQHLLDYTIKSSRAAQTGDAQLLAESRVEFNDALKERRALIQQFNDNNLRPLWQTDLAEQLLYEYLQTIQQNAAEFYELGVPTGDQAKAFDSAAVEMLEQLEDADRRFFTLIGDLPKNEVEHTQKRINTGLWDRFDRQYYQLRTPFFLAHASLYVALLPDTHPYYRNLGKNSFIRQQGKSPAEERERLLQQVIDRLEKFIEDKSDQFEIRRAAMSLAGRARFQMRKMNEAADQLDPVIATNQFDLTDLISRIARAYVFEGAGQPDEAVGALDAALAHGLVQQNLLYRLMVVDARHQILLRRAMALPAAQRAQGLAEAYVPYEKMLSDDKLGASLPAIRAYIYRRWESSISESRDLTDEPAIVVAAIGETAQEAGRALIQQADQFAEAGDQPAAASATKEGTKKLNRAVKVNTDLLARPKLANLFKAQAMYNRAVAFYFLNREDETKQVEVCKLLIDLGDDLPDQPLGAQGIAEAMTLLRPLHTRPARPPGVEELYERGAQVLLKKYPTTEAADIERYYYAAAVLVYGNKPRPTEAIEVLRSVHASNPDYYAAQRLMIEQEQSLFRAAAGKADERKQIADRLVADATRLREEAERDMGGAEGDQLVVVKQAAGWSRLILADMAVEGGDNDIEKALSLLDGFDREFQGDDDLIRTMLSKRILFYFQMDKLEEAVTEARRMMENYPEDAAPVVDDVLTKVDIQVMLLKQQSDAALAAHDKAVASEAALKKAQAAVSLATILHEWAVGKPVEDLVPFDLILARAKINANAPEDAIKILQPLAATNSNSADVLNAFGEAGFTVAKNLLATDKTKGEQMLIQVAETYNTIITGVQPGPGGRYPTLYWNAWMRRLQISDILNQNVGDIPFRVRQLELTDPTLGNEAIKKELKRLESKHNK